MIPDVEVKQMIPDVEVKQLTTHSDDRGFFREIIRAGDPFFGEFGQWSHSAKIEGYGTPEFHIHRHQTDYWYVPVGVIRAVLLDMRDGENDDFIEYALGEGHPPVVLKIPPGVAHGLYVVKGPAHLFYITDREYDRNDEGRLSNDILGFSWENRC